MVKYKKMIVFYNGKKFVIDEDLLQVGWNLLVYDNDICVYDTTQNTEDVCKKVAFEKYKVPYDLWQVC